MWFNVVCLVACMSGAQQEEFLLGSAFLASIDRPPKLGFATLKRFLLHSCTAIVMTTLIVGNGVER
jgi:hypothetical protein